MVNKWVVFFLLFLTFFHRIQIDSQHIIDFYSFLEDSSIEQLSFFSCFFVRIVVLHA